MTETMIDRVAAEIVEQIYFERVDSAYLKSVARGIIEAMRQPTKEMVDLANNQFDWGPSGYDDAPQGSAYADTVWAAMIDAALEKVPA